MKPLAVARRYARALADVVGEKHPASLEKAAAGLSAVADVLRREAAILRFFDDPSVHREQKEAAIGAVARKARLDAVVQRFLVVLVERRRLAALPAIAEAFRSIKDQRLGIVPVEATLAVPLPAADQKRFRETLEKMTGGKVRLSLRVDPAVLGGARARIGSRVYDGTLKRQLVILRRRLEEGA